MRKHSAVIRAASLIALCLSSAVAQETRDQAVAGMRHVDPKEMDPTYTKAAPFAQKLVDVDLGHLRLPRHLALAAEPDAVSGLRLI